MEELKAARKEVADQKKVARVQAETDELRANGLPDKNRR